MGNLPTSRTENCVAGAPLSHNLINEIQDVIIAHSRASWTAPTWPIIRLGAASIIESADPDNAAHPPVRKFSGGATVIAEIPFTQGDRITAFTLELYGDGAVDATLQVLYGTRSGGQVQIGTTNNITNVPASWATYAPTVFTPTDLAANGQLSLSLTANAANLYFGYIWPVFERL